jgi:AraC-like DNA-binding protein
MEKVGPELQTIGRVIYPGLRVDLWHNAQESFDPALGYKTRFRMILVERGTGILAYGRRKHIFSAPVLICLSENEKIQLAKSSEIKAQGLYFHPGIVKEGFNFSNIRDLNTQDGWQDEIWLRPFHLRDDKWTGTVKLGPAAFARISRLFSAVNSELSLQRDGFWPCRSRSFFLEILFLLERLCSLPDVAEIELLANDTSLTEIEPVLLYLHNNYQEKLCLDGLARVFHTNRTTLTRQFHQTTGLPVMTYLNRLRINLGALMLRDTTLSINEIVERVGLTNPTHFGRSFRKVTGYSPSEYRRQFCWMLQ